MTDMGDQPTADDWQTSRSFGLSKSRITAFEQCARRLWLSVHTADLAVADDGAKGRFATGHEIGVIACALEPTGIMVEAEPDLSAALSKTRAMIDGGGTDPIFEATFAYDRVLVRVDMLWPDGNGGWAMAEVKSTTGVKAYHHGDLATQVWVITNPASLASLSIAPILALNCETSPPDWWICCR